MGVCVLPFARHRSHRTPSHIVSCAPPAAPRHPQHRRLNNLVVFTGTSILENPSTIVYYDHADSAYACSEPAQLESFTALTPPLSHFRTMLPPPGKAASCVRMHFRDTVVHNRAFTRRLRDWVHAAPTHADLLARNSAAVRTLLGVVCPFVRSMWNGMSGAIRKQVTAVQRDATPDLSEPYIVIQARGGDKVREVDIHAEGYDMLMGKGMAQLVQRHGHVVLGLPCVVVGDDQQLAVRIGERAEQVLRCSRVVLRTPGGGRTAHEQKQFNDLPLEERCASTNAVLADMDIMASAPYFVGMSISNVAVVAFYARSCVYYHDRGTYADGGGELAWSYFV